MRGGDTLLSTCLAERALEGRANLGSGRRIQSGMPELWPDNFRGHLSGLWMHGDRDNEREWCRPAIYHQRNASQVPRTEGACMLFSAIQNSFPQHRTNHNPRRKHVRTGQSTTSTISHASKTPEPSTKHSSSRNGPLKRLLVPTTTLTCARDNGHACSIAGYPPWYRWTSNTWLAMMVVSRRLAGEWEKKRPWRIGWS